MKHILRTAIWIGFALAPLYLFAQKGDPDPVLPDTTTVGKPENTQEEGSVDDLIY